MRGPSFPRTLSLAGAVALLAGTVARAAGTASAVPAPSPDLGKRLAAIEKQVDTRRQDLHVPGAALAIVKDDQVIYLKGLGQRDLAEDLPVTPDTLFAIGSSTKAFTAATVMMSADEGKLSLTDPPRKYLPYFKLRDPETNEKITISDLLCHRSGLDRTDLMWYTGVLKKKDVFRAVADVKPTAKLGEKFQYQNVMYLAAGEIAATVQKTPYRKLLARRIFKPLGMKATVTSIDRLLDSNDYALGYTWDAEKKANRRLPYRDLPSVAPAGCINCSARDMTRWLRFLLAGGVWNGKRLLSEKGFNELSVERIKLSPAVGYGYGWFLRTWNGHRVLEHGGNIDGFNAEVALMPDQHLGLVLLTNISASPLGTTTMNAVWENLVGPPASAPSVASNPASPAAPPADPAPDAGIYRLASANLEVTVSLKDGKPFIQATGQSELPLQNAGGRRWQAGPPAAPGIFVTFRPSSGDASQTEMLLEQPGGVRLVLTRAPKAPPYTPPLSVDELMSRVASAMGGEAALRRHHSYAQKFSVAMEEQGIHGYGSMISRAPDAQATTINLYAAGKRIAVQRDFFDGKRGVAEASFGPRAVLSGNALADAARSAAFYPELDWKKLYKTTAITGVTKIGVEEAYVVQRMPEKGSAVTEYVSTKSYLPLKRETRVSARGPVTMIETFSDFRSVEGVMVPFKVAHSTPASSPTTFTVIEMKFDVPVRDGVFRPRHIKGDG